MTRRRVGAAALAVLVCFLTSRASVACDACFGSATDSPLIDGARLGVFLLLGITLSVQGGFVAFFLYLRRRARQVSNEEIESEWNELQGRSRA